MLSPLGPPDCSTEETGEGVMHADLFFFGLSCFACSLVCLFACFASLASTYWRAPRVELSFVCFCLFAGFLFSVTGWLITDCAFLAFFFVACLGCLLFRLLAVLVACLPACFAKSLYRVPACEPPRLIYTL